MSIVIDRTNIDGKWFDYEDYNDLKFKIKPFRLSKRSIRPGDDLTSVLYKQALYCLLDWKGVKDVNGNDIKYTEENKQFLLDHCEELMTWIGIKSSEFNKEIVNIQKKKIS